jgi:hypothetical protein
MAGETASVYRTEQNEESEVPGIAKPRFPQKILKPAGNSRRTLE